MALFGEPSSFIGLDLGTNTIKMVELIDRRKRIEVATYASAVAPNLLVQSALEDTTAINKQAAVISRMLEAAHFSADHVIAALPSSIVFSTVMNMPEAADEQMDKAVRLNAKDVIPTDLNDVVLSWQRLQVNKAVAKSSSSKSAELGTFQDVGMVPVFVTAAPKNIVARYTKLIEKLDLTLHTLEVETLAIARAVVHESAANGLIVDMGDRVTTVHIIEAGTPRLSHTIDIGGANLTNAIATATGESFEKAEGIKQKNGLTSAAPAVVQKAISDALAPMLQKVANVRKQHEASHNVKLSKVFLVGGGAGLPGLTEHWISTNQQTATRADPWQGLSLHDSLAAKLKQSGSAYSVAIGLAARGTGPV